MPKNPERKEFRVKLTCYVTLRISPTVLAGVDDGWRQTYYQLHSDEDVAQHIAYNMVVNDLSLQQIDGFADRKEREAEVFDTEWDTEIIP